MNQLAPNGMYGWLGLAAIGGTLAYHKKLGTMGMLLGLGIGAYLYFVVDNQVATTSGS